MNLDCQKYLNISISMNNQEEVEWGGQKPADIFNAFLIEMHNTKP